MTADIRIPSKLQSAPHRSTGLRRPDKALRAPDRRGNALGEPSRWQRGDPVVASRQAPTGAQMPSGKTIKGMVDLVV